MGETGYRKHIWWCLRLENPTHNGLDRVLEMTCLFKLYAFPWHNGIWVSDPMEVLKGMWCRPRIWGCIGEGWEGGQEMEGVKG